MLIHTRVLVCFQAFVSISLCKMLVSNFSKVQDTLIDMTYLNITYLNVNIIICAQRCLSLSNVTCYSFTYSNITRQCQLGSWLFPPRGARSSLSGALYSTGAFCNTSASFKIESRYILPACYKTENKQLIYEEAKSACEAMHSHLYSVKTEEKLNLLQTINAQDYWIGLNDVQLNGTLRWTEDGTEFDESLRGLLFDSGTTNNASNVGDCILYNVQSRRLSASNCSSPFKYVCEMSPKA
ncbi:unnamed protein product [Lymnaea stagnalis]|uniref:C-type lectin domain-containing protein n=1 Tax=Lymnaea stagnalis TaxID=6523 RepID=A0AAV2ID10_LYMST